MVNLKKQEEKLRRRLQEYDVKIRQRMPEYGLFKLNTVIWRVKRALKKIVEGSYGVCDVCSESIPEQRLEVIPAAIMCVHCQHDNEHKIAKGH